MCEYARERKRDDWHAGRAVCCPRSRVISLSFSHLSPPSPPSLPSLSFYLFSSFLSRSPILGISVQQQQQQQHSIFATSICLLFPVIRSYGEANITTADKRKRFEITTGDGASGAHRALSRGMESSVSLFRSLLEDARDAIVYKYTRVYKSIADCFASSRAFKHSCRRYNTAPICADLINISFASQVYIDTHHLR